MAWPRPGAWPELARAGEDEVLRLRSEWGRVQPSAEEEDAYLEKHSWAEYGAWHLALTEAANEETKARYAFVYGDFRRVHRMDIIARPRPGARPERARGGEDEVLSLQLLDATRA